MKKLLALLSAAALLGVLSACAAKNASDSATSSQKDDPDAQTSRTETTSQNAAGLFEQEFYDLYGCPNSKRTAKLQLKRKKLL